MDEVFSSSTAGLRFNALLIGAFALLAVMMTAGGMYSVISCLVSQRTNEIAVRIALGASRSSIIKTVWAATGAWVLGGLAGGLALGFAARTTIRTFSNSTASGAPGMYAAIAVFFLVVTLFASYVPLMRATRLDPAVALRCE